MQCTPTLNELYREQKRLHSPTQWALYTWSKCMICLFLSTLPPPHSSNITVVTKTCIRELLWKKKKKKRGKKNLRRGSKVSLSAKQTVSPLQKSCTRIHIFIYICIYMFTYIYKNIYIFFFKRQNSPRRGDWRRPFHIAGPSCNPQPSCSAAVLGGIWRRGPGKTPHTSCPGHSVPWMFAAPLSCESRTQTVAAYTRTLR